MLKSDNIILGLKSESKEEAIERAGKMLVKEGYVNNNYIAAMQEREKMSKPGPDMYKELSKLDAKYSK